jgi:hypothetical protein
MKTGVYQFAYNNESFEARDSRFLFLDNRENPRPDWRECWPIRQFIFTQILEKDSLYGFFPKSRDKTVIIGNQRS